jgi:hypothetical protein
MAVPQTSTLFAGDVSKQAIYEIDNGEGMSWAPYVRTEINIGGNPRQLRKAKHAGNPIVANVANPRRATDFPAGATVDFDQRTLSVTRFMVPDTYKPSDWLDDFPRFQPSGLSIDLKANPEIQKVIFNRIKNAVMTQLNANHSAGDSALGVAHASGLGLYDGFVTGIIADADATQVGTPAVLTAANIKSEMYELRNAVEPRLRKKSNLTIFMSYADFDIADEVFKQTQTSTAENALQGTPSITKSEGGRMVFRPIEGIPKDFMFITVAGKGSDSNLVQGVWVEGDNDTLKLYREVDTDEDWNILMRMSAGVQHVAGEDIWYKNNV